MCIRDRYDRKWGLDSLWGRLIATYSEYSWREGSKNVALQPTWLLSLCLRTIRGPTAWARRFNSPITRIWEDFTTVVLVVLSPDADAPLLAAQQSGDVRWTAPVRRVQQNKPKTVWQALFDCHDQRLALIHLSEPPRPY